jgi:hypothetical protein
MLAFVQLGLPAATRGAASVVASRAELLYSADANPDCSQLSQRADGALPLNIVRLRATVTDADPARVRYRWSMPRPAVGILAADLDLGPGDETSAVRALCSEFGNACILTEDKLPYYNEPTILWAAPTCAVLPTKTVQNFAGGTVRLGVSVSQGRRRVGKAATTVGFGRAASVILFSDGRDGVGVAGGVPSGVASFFGAIEDARGVTLPPGRLFNFDNGAGGASATTTGCDGDVRFDACVGDLLYQQAGTFVASVQETFEEGSALCDNITMRVLSATIIPRLEVTASPRPGTYVPGDPRRGTVGLRVRLVNASPREGGSGILLRGSGVLTCSSEIRLGGTTDARLTAFDLQRCSETTDQPCTTDGECRPPFCPECNVDEVCFTTSHCSNTFNRECNHDSDCEAPRCPICAAGETCIHVLATPSIVVGIGESIDLVDTTVPVANVFPTTARITDTWTVNTFNAGSDQKTLRYRILGRPRAGSP